MREKPTLEELDRLAWEVADAAVMATTAEEKERRAQRAEAEARSATFNDGITVWEVLREARLKHVQLLHAAYEATTEYDAAAERLLRAIEEWHKVRPPLDQMPVRPAGE